jgi:indole-3-glycerol phosphate synthase
VLAGGLLAELVAVAADLGLEVVVEIHDERDLERAVALGAPMVGINSRDLATFRVDLVEAGRLASLVPPGRVVVIESGIGGCDQARAFVSRGLRQFLVGEHLLRAEDPARAVRELVECA